MVGAATTIPFALWWRESAQASGSLRLRRDFASLETGEDDLEGLILGIRRMMALPKTHPLSWIFQANVHLTQDDPASFYPGDPGLQSLVAMLWNNCPHGSYFFLPWHRMYLFFFERRLRQLSGRPRMALPYWNYVADDPQQRRLPALFRQPIRRGSANPLFVPDTQAGGPPNGRDARYNAGAQFDPADVSIVRAFSALTFTDRPARLSFGGHPPPQSFLFGALEETPHNNIHAGIGGAHGWMSDLSYAARDPIFFLHHANVDRLWESWLALGQGRANPVDDAFLNQTWSFVDEWARIVTVSAAEVLAIQSQLGYAYDVLEPQPTAKAMSHVMASARTPSEAPVFAAADVVVDHEGLRIALVPTGERATGTTWRLNLEGITVEDQPPGTLGLWLNDEFVAALALFAAQPQGKWPGCSGTTTRGFDVAAPSGNAIWLRLNQITPRDADGTPMAPQVQTPIRIARVRLGLV